MTDLSASTVADNLARALESIPVDLREDDKIKGLVAGIEATMSDPGQPLLAWGFDPIFFGILVALNTQTAFNTPPVAMACISLPPAWPTVWPPRR